jgi:hypothetical protein
MSNESLIREFTHPDKFSEYTQTPFSYSRAMCLSLYKSCECLKAELLKQKVDMDELKKYFKEFIELVVNPEIKTLKDQLDAMERQQIKRGEKKHEEPNNAGIIAGYDINPSPSDPAVKS